MQFHDVDMDKFSQSTVDGNDAAVEGADEATGDNAASVESGNPAHVAQALMKAHDDSTQGALISEHSFRRHGGAEY